MALYYSARIWLILMIACAVFGWGFFLVAAIRSSVYTESHAMRGYEWIGGVFIAPLALLTLCYMPRMSAGRLADPEMWAVHDRAMNCRITITVTLTLMGFVISLVTTWIDWFAPPHHHAAAAVAPSIRTAHTSATPTPSMAPIIDGGGGRNATDITTGVLMLCHLMSLCSSVLFGWLFTVAPTASEQQEEVDNMGL
jgi:hypothetical protein